MEYRQLGTSGLKIAPLVFGGNVFGWTVDEASAFRLLDAFVDGGFNCVDTADIYPHWAPGQSGGESEEIIGAWQKARGSRDRIIISTKTGVTLPGREGGLAPARLERAVDEALVRLKTDYIDLLQSHVDDESVPIADTLDAYDKLIKAGKVRYVGVSNFPVQRLGEALAIAKKQQLPSYVSLQPWYNLYDRGEFEGGMEQFCLDHHIGVITYFSLASGFLTGKYRTAADLEGRPRGYRAGGYLTDRGKAILAALDQVAAEQAAKPAQIALAWLMHRPAVTAPIASATSLQQLREIMAASEVRLTEAQLALLDKASWQKPGTPIASAETPPPEATEE